jgi:hypothetical protein
MYGPQRPTAAASAQPVAVASSIAEEMPQAPAVCRVSLWTMLTFRPSDRRRCGKPVINQ